MSTGNKIDLRGAVFIRLEILEQLSNKHDICNKILILQNSLKREGKILGFYSFLSEYDRLRERVNMLFTRNDAPLCHGENNSPFLLAPRTLNIDTFSNQIQALKDFNIISPTNYQVRELKNSNTEHNITLLSELLKINSKNIEIIKSSKVLKRRLKSESETHDIYQKLHQKLQNHCRAILPMKTNYPEGIGEYFDIIVKEDPTADNFSEWDLSGNIKIHSKIGSSPRYHYCFLKSDYENQKKFDSLIKQICSRYNNSRERRPGKKTRNGDRKPSNANPVTQTRRRSRGRGRGRGRGR
jgi:hypothetical protein